MCPTCKVPFEREQVSVDKDFQRELQNLEVYCTNEPAGCNWEGIFKNIIVFFLNFLFVLRKN